MKESDLISSLDLILDCLKKGDTEFAKVLCLALKVRLHSMKENSKINREIGKKKKEMIKAIKKL